MNIGTPWLASPQIREDQPSQIPNTAAKSHGKQSPEFLQRKWRLTKEMVISITKVLITLPATPSAATGILANIRIAQQERG
jgi:hypothetical protein